MKPTVTNPYDLLDKCDGCDGIALFTVRIREDGGYTHLCEHCHHALMNHPHLWAINSLISRIFAGDVAVEVSA